MASERENKLETHYGSLVMRSYNISGNDINAFYDASGDLVFVLDKTINDAKPNVLLVINPDSDKKWDEILSNKYGVDLETIRPKQDNKYQKLDIEYSGLAVYDNLVNTFISGNDISDDLTQLNVLRNSATRHSAMVRLNAANEIISRTNVTIVKTKESIVRLEARLKMLRGKLADTKKEIGRVSTKQSAAKILKIESQIDATKEKLKRAKKRLESAQKRMEIATVDAELASNVLNQPDAEIKTMKTEPIMVAPKHEIQTIPSQESDESDEVDDLDEDFEFDGDVKPLIDQDPQIVDENIAFKPINFETPNSSVENVTPAFPTSLSVPDSDQDSADESDEHVENFNQVAPVLESLTPVDNAERQIPSEPINYEPVANEEFNEEENWNSSDNNLSEQDDMTKIDEPIDVQPVSMDEGQRPVAPMVKGDSEQKPLVVSSYEDSNKKTKQSFVYYILLLVLIALSVFALWLYQKNIGNTKPVLSVPKSTVVQQERQNVAVAPAPVLQEVAVQPESDMDDVFVDAEPVQPKYVEDEPVEPVVQTESAIAPESEPLIMGVVSDKVSAFSNVADTEEIIETPENTPVVEPVVNKPVYGAGEKYQEMFLYEDDNTSGVYDEYDEDYAEPVVYYSDQNLPEMVDESGVVYTNGGFDNESDLNYPAAVYQDDVFYDNYDPEEAAYQAGNDGYDEY